MKKFIVTLGTLAPSAAFAAGGLEGAMSKILSLINTVVIPFIFALAVVWFLWGVFLYVKSAGEDGDKKKGQGVMLWGIVGIAVMASVYALVNLLKDTIVSTTDSDNNTIVLPQTPTQ